MHRKSWMQILMKSIIAVLTATWKTAIILKLLKTKILRYHCCCIPDVRPVTGFCLLLCRYRNAVSVDHYYWKATRPETTTQETSFDYSFFFTKFSMYIFDLYDFYILKTVSSIPYILVCLYYWRVIVRSPIYQKVMPGGLRTFQLAREHTKIW